jgi:hypothetical protein
MLGLVINLVNLQKKKRKKKKEEKRRLRGIKSGFHLGFVVDPLLC